MEAPVNPPSPGAAVPPPAELVVVSGRLSGARHPLTGPLILFGRAPGCEVRLNVDGVQPLHAALVHGPDGFFLRDLAGGGVLVNDGPATSAPLRHADVIAVGPFQFRLEITAPSGEKAMAAERDAVRVQSAAVAAQQAALTEEEMRLLQRRGALEEQEGQLAGRLEERRRRLLDLQEQTRQERAAFQAALASADQEQAAIRKELEAARDDAAAAGKQAAVERRRLVELRKRLRRRWRRHWDAKEAELTRREAGLNQDAQRLQRDREAITAERLRFNGDVELGKRRMRDQWQELALAQQQWETCLNQEHAEREKRVRELAARAAAVEETERTWTGRERSVRLTLVELHRESAGLEARVKNQREKLAEEEAAVARLRAERGAEIAFPAIALPSPAAPAGPAGEDGTAVLRRVAEDLTDQRAHLLEQWQALLRVQEEWRKDREQALAALESAGRSLQEREQRLAAQEWKLDAAAAEWRQRQQSLSQMRNYVEGWQARLKVRDLGWESERTALLEEVRAREAAAALQAQRFHDLARSRELQRGKEAEELAAARARCEDVRRQYVALWEESQQRRKELARDQRDLAARTLAAERLRLEIVGKAPHSARAERKLERLRRTSAARIDAAEREIESARKALGAQSARLDALAQRLGREQDELAARFAELTRERHIWEEQRAGAEVAEQRRQLEQKRLDARRGSDERLIAQLRDEVERIAGVLMEDQTETPAAAAQAA